MPSMPKKAYICPDARASAASLPVRTMRSQGHSRHSAAASGASAPSGLQHCPHRGSPSKTSPARQKSTPARTSPSMFPGAGGPDGAVPAPASPRQTPPGYIIEKIGMSVKDHVRSFMLPKYRLPECPGRCRSRSRRYPPASPAPPGRSSPGKSPCPQRWWARRCWHWRPE